MFDKTRQRLAEIITPKSNDEPRPAQNEDVIKLAESLVGSDYYKNNASDSDGFADKMLEDLIDSGSNCGSVARNVSKHCKKDLGHDIHTVDYLVHHLPGLKPITALVAQLIQSGGLRADKDSDQDKLDAWLQNKDTHNETNLMSIQTAIEAALQYGHSGLRLFTDKLEDLPINFMTFQDPSKWIIWTAPVNTEEEIRKGIGTPGLTKITYYEYRSKWNKKTDAKKNKLASSKEIEELQKTLVVFKNGVLASEDGLRVFIPPELFCHLKLNGNNIYGESPLDYDRLRIQLTVDSYNANIDDVNNDGIGRLILKTIANRSTAGKSTASIISDDTMESIAEAAQNNQLKKKQDDAILKETRGLAKEIKESQRDSVIAINGSMFDDVTRLERMTKGTDYLDYMQKSIIIAANIYGIHPALIGGTQQGYTSSSIQPIIEFTINNYINPLQQIFNSQLSPYIVKAAKLNGGVKFSEYDTKDPETIAKIQEMCANTAAKLLSVGVQTDDVYDYLDGELGTTIEKGENLRLVGNTFGLVDDAVVK